MESLRIGMFSWESLYSIKVGGISPHVTEIAESLAKRGHEVHIFTRRGGFNEYDEINDVHYQRCEHDISGSIVHQMDKMCNAMYEKFDDVKKKFGDFDIIHGHDWHPVNALNRIKQRYNLPYTMTFHSTEWGRCGNQFSSSWESHAISHREWLGGYEASNVIITTPQFKQEVQDIYQIPDDKISVIPNGIFPGKIKKKVDAGEVKEQYGIHPFAPVILFTGRMSYQKGADLLVEAIPKVLQQHWDTQFVFIGEGELRMHCENMAWAKGVHDSSHFLGYVPDDTLSNWMNACDMTCVPSRNEPFGIVVLESWDACKPVVATDAVHLVDNFANGIVSYKTSDSIAWGINYSLGGLDSSCKKMGLNGNKLVKTRYNWKTIAKDTEYSYRNLT